MGWGGVEQQSSLAQKGLSNKTTNTPNTQQHGTVYCGMTKRKFSDRMSEHRDYAKFSKIEEPSGEHFNSAGHSFHNLQGSAL